MKMDQYIRKALEGEFFWCDNPPVLSQTAFVPYTSIAEPEKSPNCETNSMNMNKRMVQFLKRSWAPPTARTETGRNYNERGLRHMLNERMRRENHKQSYSALHSMLPSGTKSDKNWIMQTTIMYIQQLNRHKEELRKRNMELAAILVANEKDREYWSKIRLRVANPASGVDSMLLVLNCLKYLGLKSRNVHSNFSAEEFSTELEIQTKIGAAEIEEAMQETLNEAERTIHFSFPGR